MLMLARRARGHFVTLIEIRVHLIRVKPGHIFNKPFERLDTNSLSCQFLPPVKKTRLISKHDINLFDGTLIVDQ